MENNKKYVVCAELVLVPMESLNAESECSDTETVAAPREMTFAQIADHDAIVARGVIRKRPNLPQKVDKEAEAAKVSKNKAKAKGKSKKN